ncbi:FMN-binding protein [Curtobacterium sp. ODYSSEY 48 V2]|uniref:FMN-binding protein n=1 Tax=Curtobacterium sp. ODYSSEY 48 V2 TaxID=2939561 RepID=UPI00203C38AD|nr:FMN-binding protein [Curtobacterium sp. ODYSSEY 48 V2]MCM3506047.1 FMN-binding protein [Curtobacterium sp. ODYSSEY 48 V2]
MRARVVAGGVLSSVAVLAIGWQLGGQPAVTTPAQGTTSGIGSSGSAGSGGTSGSSASGSSASGSSGASDSGTFTGAAAQTQYGEVQVQITVADGKITDVTPLHLTDRDGRSVAISQQAAPILRQEALQTQSAQIQAVSGATFTSGGYTTSLQSAIDQAGL